MFFPNSRSKGKAWHVSHFTCYQCKLPLGGQQYKMADLNQKENRSLNDDKMRLEDLHRQPTKDIRPFCLACCDQLFGEYCARCETLITCDQSPVKFETYFWHATPECFHCDTCGITLVNSDYLPSSSAKQIFCSTKCAQSLQAKDLNNINNGLMKLNDRLRNNQHKPTLNSVKEEDDLSCSVEDQVDKQLGTGTIKVEYENSSMFHLVNKSSPPPTRSGEERIENSVQSDSPSSDRSSSRSLSSLSILFSSSPDSPDRNEVNSHRSTPINEQTKNGRSMESVTESACSTESNQLNTSTQTMIAKETKSTDSEQVLKKEEHNLSGDEQRLQYDKVTGDAEQSTQTVDNQKLIPYVIVNNNPFTRTSIIIDNLNTTLSTMQILDDEFTAVADKQTNNSLASSTQSTKSLQSIQSDQSASVQTSLNSTSPVTESIVRTTENQIIYSTSSKQEPNSSSSSPLSKSALDSQLDRSNDSQSDSSTKSTSINNRVLQHGATSSSSLNNGESIQNNIQNMFDSVQPTYYSTLPTRRTQRKPFKFEEPMTTTVHQMNNHHYPFMSHNSTAFPVLHQSSQSINVNSKPIDSMNEVGLPVFNMKSNRMNNRPHFDNVNLLGFVNCTLPRSNRHQSNGGSNGGGGYLNGVQSVSVCKLNATMLQAKFNRYNSSCNNLSINTSTNSDFSTTSSNKQSSSSNNSNVVVLNNNLNSHSVVVSEDQIESLNSQLIVKPLPNSKQLPTRTPPLPPTTDQQHGFIRKWSTTNPTSITQTSSITTNQLTDLPVIQEHHLVTNNNNNQTSSERTSSATPSLSSSIELQSNDTNEKEELNETANRSNLVTMQNFSSSNNSLNIINLMQPNLNSSNSASLISATSSISSTMSSTETTPQSIGLSNHHNRPDVILNPIETIKQLKQKQRELKLKEKMLKKAEQQSIDLKPKIVEEQLKTSTPALPTKPNDEASNELLCKRKNNTRRSSELPERTTRLNNSVSNSLSSLTSRTNTTANNQMIKQQQLKLTNQSTYRSQPNLHSVQLINSSSNGETCSNASTPDELNRIEQLNQINHLNQLNKLNQLSQLNHLKQSTLNQSPSSQYSPTNSVSVNDTDCSSVVNSVEMDNIVQFKNGGGLQAKQSPHKKQRQPQSSSLKDSQFSGKNCESQSNLKQKSVSFDPNVIENENNKAQKRLSRKAMNGHHYSSRYSSPDLAKKKYHDHQTGYESHSRRKRNYQRDHHGHYESSSSHRRHGRRQGRRQYEDDDFCSTCSSSSCSSSSSFCSSSDEEEANRSYSCHGRKNQIKKHQQQQTKAPVDKLSQLTGQNVTATTSIPAEQMVKIMQQQQLIIQQQLAQMQQPQLKQQRYLKNNTNESCVIS